MAVSSPRDSEAYVRQMRALLPRGAAWRFPAGGIFAALLGGLAAEFARIDQRALDLIEESDPRTTLELLGDWETTAGLPDACTGSPDTAAERQVALHQKVTSTGGQSIAYFTELALKLGYVIEIEEHRPAAIGMDCDGPLYGEPWAFAWTVHVLPFDGYLEGALDVAVAEVGDDIGVRLRGWGSLDLECVIARARPAHTIVLFTYEVEPEPALWIDFTEA